jgi:hypothetical protein
MSSVAQASAVATSGEAMAVFVAAITTIIAHLPIENICNFWLQVVSHGFGGTVEYLNIMYYMYKDNKTAIKETIPRITELVETQIPQTIAFLRKDPDAQANRGSFSHLFSRISSLSYSFSKVIVCSSAMDNVKKIHDNMLKIVESRLTDRKSVV